MFFDKEVWEDLVSIGFCNVLIGFGAKKQAISWKEIACLKLFFIQL